MSDLIAKVKEMYAAFSRGDAAFIVGNVADQVSWEVEGPSEITSSGIRRSPNEVVQFFAAIADQAESQKLEMTEFLSSGETVASFGRYQGTIKATGVPVDIPIAHYFKFRDGKIVRFAQVSNTAAVLEAIRGHATAAAPS